MVAQISLYCSSWVECSVSEKALRFIFFVEAACLITHPKGYGNRQLVFATGISKATEKDQPA